MHVGVAFTNNLGLVELTSSQFQNDYLFNKPNWLMIVFSGRNREVVDLSSISVAPNLRNFAFSKQQFC